MSKLSLLQQIVDWFKDAKPNPTISQIDTQVGAHLEEVAEMVKVLQQTSTSYHVAQTLFDLHQKLDEASKGFYSGNLTIAYPMLNNTAKIELLDAICDQQITSTGVGVMLGFDVEGALQEVVRSNDTKRLEDGSFVYNRFGKVMKPKKTFEEAQLAPFIGVNNKKE